MNKFDDLVVHALGNRTPPSVEVEAEFEKILDAVQDRYPYSRTKKYTEADLNTVRTIVFTALRGTQLCEDMQELIKRDILSKTSVVGIQDYLAFHC